MSGKADVDLYLQEQLGMTLKRFLCCMKPQRVVPPEIWDELRLQFTAGERGQELVSRIAGRLGLRWPSAHTGKSLRDFAALSLDEISAWSGIGPGTVCILVACFADATVRLDGGGEPAVSPTAVPDQFLGPQDASAGDWESWRTAVAGCPDYRLLTIRRVARCLGQSWPASRSHEMLQQFAGYSADELDSLPGIGSKKRAVLHAVFRFAAAGCGRGLSPGELLGNREVTTNVLVSQNPDWDRWSAAVLESPALSDLSVCEIAHTLGIGWPASRRHEVLRDYATLRHSQLGDLSGIGPKKIETLHAVFRFAAEKYESETTQADVLAEELQIADLAPEAQIRKLVSRLPDQLEAVLMHRFGLGTAPPLRLHEVGPLVGGVSRERIRQLEVKALEELQFRGERELAKRALSARSREVFTSLAEGREMIPASSSFSRMAWHQAGLSGELYLALKIVYGSVAEWLSREFVATPEGWYRVPEARGELQHGLERLKLLSGRACLPIPASLAAPLVLLGADQLRAAARQSSEFSLYQDYVLEGRASRRPRRTVRLHRLMLSEFADSLPTVPELLLRYRVLYQDDPAGGRDLQISLNSAAHLFLEIGGTGWTALAPGGWAPPKVEGPTAEVRYSSDRLAAADKVQGEADIQAPEHPSGISLDPEKDTIAARLASLFAQAGPMRLTDVVDRFAEGAPAGRFSTNSVAPVLLLTGTFARLAPGYWGLARQAAVIDRTTGTDDDLLNERHVRTYARSRHAGDPRGYFPLWTPGMELAWNRWAEGNASREVFQSLLSVSEPESWPCDLELRDHWASKKKRFGLYRLDEIPKYLLEQKPPRLRDVIEAGIYLRIHRHIHWIQANRIAGRRAHSHGSAALLAILVGVGAIEAPHHWQTLHAATKDAGWPAFAPVVAELFNSGTISWEHGAGAELLKRVLSRMPSARLGWVDPDQLESLVGLLLERGKALTEPSPRNRSAAARRGVGEQADSTAPPDEEDDDPLAALLAEHTRSHEEKQLERLLNESSGEFEALTDRD